MKAIAATFLVTLALGAAGVAGLICAGRINFAADEPHGPWVGRLIETARDRFIAAQSGSVAVPDLNAPERIADGAAHYAPMCAGCHLAPGVEDTELRRGLYPQPPNLATAAAGANAARQFWIIKHGIKGSAMPAWGTSHDDAALWSLVAFLQKLPQLSPEEYAAMTAPAASPHSHAHSHSH